MCGEGAARYVAWEPRGRNLKKFGNHWYRGRHLKDHQQDCVCGCLSRTSVLGHKTTAPLGHHDYFPFQ